MSGPLVPFQPTFQQQGTVDWVELSGRKVNFTVAVLARLSKAGIDPFTLQVGRAICANFSLEPNAQQRVSDAIGKLKKYGSYENIIWFGFGIKHVVTDLAETEEGLTLVSICAALSVTYDSLFGARVLRELCGLCKAPSSFSPAIRQWKTLIELCSGILTSGHFLLVLDGFRRLVTVKDNQHELKHGATTYLVMAEALMTIGQVTSKKLLSATFSGGFDCIWLAAVAEWIFSLEVAIHGSSGQILYRSRNNNHQPAQISIGFSLPVHAREAKNLESLVSGKASLIQSGRCLIVREDEKPLGDPHWQNWRSSWSTILHDTFHGDFDNFMEPENAHHFGIYLYCISMFQGPRDTRDHSTGTFYPENDVDPLLWSHRMSRGHVFLQFAERRLPELKPCFKTAFGQIDPGEIIPRGAAALRAMIESGDELRWLTLAQTIVVFLWINLVCEIDEDVSPSITGLSDLCARVTNAGFDGDKAPFYIKVHGLKQAALVFHVLTGAYTTREPTSDTLESSNTLAMAGSGICVYRKALEDPNLPPGSISTFRVVRGYIAHHATLFRRIDSLSAARHTSSSSFERVSSIISIETMVQETDRDTELAMSYRVQYVDSHGEKKVFFLDLGHLFCKLQDSMIALHCVYDCLALSPLLRYDQHRKHPMALPSRENFERVQELFSNIRDDPNTWGLTSIRNPNQHVRELNILVDELFVIYLSLANLSQGKHSILASTMGHRLICMFPIIRCVNCMIEEGINAATIDSRSHRLKSTTNLNLLLPGDHKHTFSLK